MPIIDLSKTPIHLGGNGDEGSALTLPVFEGGHAWYEQYGTDHPERGGRLLTLHHFSCDWETWEMHPAGAEVVIVVKGAMTVVQDIDGERREHLVKAGETIVNPPGVWHTAKVAEPTSALFITPGEGTLNEARD